MSNNSSLFQSDLTSAGAADAATYVQTNLVSDISGLAEATDPHLVNPWGVSFRLGSPFWVSDQGTNSTTLYSVTDSTDVNNPVPVFTVNIPTTETGPQGPTGQVSNTNVESFKLTDGNLMSASFIFADLNGTISAWNPSLGTDGSTAHIEVTTPGAVYTGLAVNEAHTMLYAANDSAGTIDVFNSSFDPVDLGDHAFRTPGQIAARGLVPFNVTDIGGDVYVTYAPAGRAAQTTAGPGEGAVAVFTESGKLEPHGVLLGGPHTPLASPWGVAIAPNDFGQFSGDLLVGNFSFLDSEINAFDPQTHKLAGTIPISAGSGHTPGGLWTLTFGGGGNDGSPTTLYFTDGIDGETHGLFGAMTSVPLVGTSTPTHSEANVTGRNVHSFTETSVDSLGNTALASQAQDNFNFATTLGENRSAGVHDHALDTPHSELAGLAALTGTDPGGANAFNTHEGITFDHVALNQLHDHDFLLR